MLRPAVLAALMFVGVVAPAIADGGPGGFSPPVAVGSGSGYMAAGALGRGGDAALAWTTTPGAVLAIRGVPATGAWGANEVLSPGSFGARDIQVAVGDETIVAWAEWGRDMRQRVMAAIAPPGGPFGGPQVVAELPGILNSTPRLVMTTSGRAVLVWHQYRGGRQPPPGAVRYALSVPGQGFGRPRLLTSAGRSPTLVATRGDVICAWRTRRGLRAANLASAASRFGASYLVSRSAGSNPRLVSGPDGTVVASWVSLASRVLTRHIRPLGRVEEVARLASSEFPPGPALAVGSGGRSIMAFRGRLQRSTGATQNRLWVATRSAKGIWPAPQPLTGPITQGQPTFAVAGAPRTAISARGDDLVIWPHVGHPGPSAGETRIALRTSGSASFGTPAPLGPGAAFDAGGTVLAQRGATILAAWPSPDPARVMLVATRSGP